MFQVLLIDDEPIIQLGIRKMIPWEDTSYQLCGTAPNGQDALDFIQNNPVDMIITDLKMPVMDGISLIRTLKARQINIPVLVLSNYSDFDLVREALLEGAVDYLLKVDLSKDSLLGQLDKMAAKVKRTQADQLQKQQQELMLAKKNKEVFLAKLRSFFLDSHYTYEDLCEQVDSPEYFVPPFLIMTIIFREADMKKEKMHRVLPHIEIMAAAVFSPCKTILIYLHHNELLCIVSAFSLTEDELRQRPGSSSASLPPTFLLPLFYAVKRRLKAYTFLKKAMSNAPRLSGLPFTSPVYLSYRFPPGIKYRRKTRKIRIP